MSDQLEKLKELVDGSTPCVDVLKETEKLITELL